MMREGDRVSSGTAITRGIKRIIAYPLLRNNSFFFLSTVVVGLANYLLNTTATRRFAPGNYSQFGVVLNLVVIFLPLSGAMISAVMRRASYNRMSQGNDATEAIQRTIVRYLTIFFAGLLTVTFIAHEPIGRFLRLTTVVPLYFVVVIVYWLFLQGLLQAILQEEGKYGRISAIFVGEGVFRATLGVTVILAGLGINAALAVYMLSAILATLFLPRPHAFWTGERAPHRALFPIYRDIGPLLLSNIGFSFLTTLDVILCRRYLSPITADQYVAIAAMAKFFLSATGSVSTIAFAEIVKAAHHGESSARPLGFSLVLIGGLGVPFVAFCVLFGPFVMNLAFGSAFRASGDQLWITATSAFAVSLLGLETAYFNARHWLGYLPVFLLGSVVTIAALPLAHQSLGGYAGTYAITTSVLALIFLIPVFLGLTGRLTLGTAQQVAPLTPVPLEPVVVTLDSADSSGIR